MQQAKKILDDLILELISKNAISDQSQLKELIESHGFSISQATLSRKLNKLKIAKVSNVYQTLQKPIHRTTPILNYRKSHPNLIVLHTEPGHAGALGAYIDSTFVIKSHPNILGCIAGDDTVLVVTDGIKDLDLIYSMISSNR